MSTTAPRYTAVAILLHWAIALALAGQIALGWWMGDAMSNPVLRGQAIAGIQLHKSIGLTILLLSLIRLGWRLTHKAPPLPAHMPAWEKVVALATHWTFYALIILMPLTGWIYVSAGWSAFDHHPLDVPTYYFGLFHVPHLFNLDHAALTTRQVTADTAFFFHEKLVWVTIILAVLHVAAALKHHFVNKDEVLALMIPGLKPRDPAVQPEPAARGRATALGVGFIAIAVAAAFLITAFENPAHRAAAPPPATTAIETTTLAETTTTVTTTQTVATTTAASHPVGPPPAWIVDQARSAIAFTASAAGVSFDGGFSRWRADIRFDPNNLAQSRADVTIEAVSIHTGDAQRDEALPEAEWFDTAAHPTATFRATSFRHLGGNRYEARGNLSIKDVSQPVRLPFTLAITGNHATVRGSVSLDRLALNLGKESFPDETNVARAVGVSVHVEATRAP
ncbi:MAG: YceI family protein [Alphaproteobacteria bacterium]